MIFCEAVFGIYFVVSTISTCLGTLRKELALRSIWNCVVYFGFLTHGVWYLTLVIVTAILAIFLVVIVGSWHCYKKDIVTVLHSSVF